ncbi:MAG: YqeG family HAD IIIA-type phosphatase [Eubacterium sp.]|nr:YqeG family HAD IIIA-type phosphatase [Eubacterium sp.]
MLERFYPDEYLKSIDEVDFEKYYKQGIRGIISDIDNTLVPHGFPADEHIIKVFEKIRNLGMDICLISNNDEPRVKPFAEAVQSKYIYDAHKPSRKNYMKAMELMGTDKDTTLFLGDQIFTDVWGANRTGIHSIMLEKINPKEEIQIVLKRIPERFVLWTWKKNKK